MGNVNISDENTERLADRLRGAADTLDGGGSWTTRKFWMGFAWGVLAMAVLDLTDLHICIGDCDGAGYDIIGPRK